MDEKRKTVENTLISQFILANGIIYSCSFYHKFITKNKKIVMRTLNYFFQRIDFHHRFVMKKTFFIIGVIAVTDNLPTTYIHLVSCVALSWVVFLCLVLWCLILSLSSDSSDCLLLLFALPCLRLGITSMYNLNLEYYYKLNPIPLLTLALTQNLTRTPISTQTLQP